MSTRRADSALFTRLHAFRTTGKTLEQDLRKWGDGELADVVKRALRELQSPAFTGPDNKR